MKIRGWNQGLGLLRFFLVTLCIAMALWTPSGVAEDEGADFGPVVEPTGPIITKEESIKAI